MAQANTSGGGSVSAPASPADIRNVVLVGPSGAGKTTLLEAMLAATGTIPRAGRTTEGTTVSDFDDAEVRQQRSVGLALAPVLVDGVKINFLDTPGYADFVGDLRAGLRAADAALFVLSAVDGVDGGTQMLWEECAAVGMPRAVVVTRLDHPRADFEELVAICQRVFGEGVMPLMLPMMADDGTPAGFIDLITERIHDYSSGSRVDRAPEPAHLDLIESTRAGLIEGIIAESEDETLMDRYLAGEHIDTDSLITDLEMAVARGSFYPVIATAVELGGLGTTEVLDLVRRGFPSPLEHPLPPVATPEGQPRGPLECDPSGPLCAEVVKTTTDPYVGRLSLVRVFSGRVTPDAFVHVSGHFGGARGHEDHDLDERIGALSSPLGKVQRTIDAGIAGDIVAVAKLTRAETGDTLSDKDTPLLMEPWLMPDALLPVAVVAKSKADEDKLGAALNRLVAEDATLRLDRNAETGQLVLWCMGEAHVDVLLDRLRNRYGVAVESEELRVSLRETFAAAAKAKGRHVKQSGGHGQYAVCDIEVAPLPAGSGFEFVDKVVGGSVPRQFIPSVEKGVRAQMERGVVAGYPVVDIQVTLYDGKSHSVDSSDMAFQMAGALALKEAAAAAQIAMLEPVASVSVLVSDEYVGAVMGDLSGRRGRVAGTEPAGNGRTLIKAEVPELELTRYAIELRSMSHGTGTFNRTYIGHEPMPAQIAKKVIDASPKH
ncbi:MAG TPA: elongation factor G-like protein EF-G2 [Motilibacterales bacterium]|nr:elongation factor G-like protein EF-G2 [Motilibacterales bacterium]